MHHNLPTVITDTLDETGVAAFTAQSRTKWAEIRERLEQDPVNRASLEAMDSAFILCSMETTSPDPHVSWCTCVYYITGLCFRITRIYHVQYFMEMGTIAGTT